MPDRPHPPGPRGDTLLGCTLDFKDEPLSFIRYVHRAYGDVSRFRIGPVHWYLIGHPDHVWDMMTQRGHIFLKPRIAKRLWDKFLGDGLLTTEGEVWKRQHRMVKPAFRRIRIANYGRTMVDFTQRMIDGWTPGQEINIGKEMTALTVEVVAKTLFDADIRDGGSEVIGEAMHVLQEAMVDHIHMPVPVPRWWPSERNKRKLAAIAAIEDIVHDVIEERRASGEDRGDLLSMLLMSTDSEGVGLSDKEIRDQSMTLIFAGHETTANSLTWAWFILAKYPEITARLQQDIDRVTGGAPLTLEHLKELPYLDQCIKESMRILPSVWVFMKAATEDTEIGGYHIPKGAPLLISPYVLQHDERWFPRPETFDPDRFSAEREPLIPKGAFVPFSGGARICLGRHFAMMEMRLMLGTMLQRANPRLKEGYRRRYKAELSMHPDGPLPMTVEKRESGPPLLEVATG